MWMSSFSIHINEYPPFRRRRCVPSSTQTCTILPSTAPLTIARYPPIAFPPSSLSNRQSITDCHEFIQSLIRGAGHCKTNLLRRKIQYPIPSRRCKQYKLGPYPSPNNILLPLLFLPPPPAPFCHQPSFRPVRRSHGKLWRYPRWVLREKNGPTNPKVSRSNQ